MPVRKRLGFVDVHNFFNWPIPSAPSNSVERTARQKRSFISHFMKNNDSRNPAIWPTSKPVHLAQIGN